MGHVCRRQSTTYFCQEGGRRRAAAVEEGMTATRKKKKSIFRPTKKIFFGPKECKKGPPPWGGRGGEEGREGGKGMFAGRPFPPLSLPFPPFPSPRSGASRPHNHRPSSPAPRSLRVRLSEKGGPALQAPPLGHRTLRSRLPAAVPEVPSLFSFSEKGKNEKMGLFLAIQKIKFKKIKKRSSPPPS